MADIKYDLKTAKVSVEGGQIKFDDQAATELDGVTFGKGYIASVVETKHGLLAADASEKTYDFTALTGGSFSFVDSEKVSVQSFDGSGVASAIKVTVSHGSDAADNSALKSVITGSGKDVVTVKKAQGVSFDLGAGNDSIAITDVATATVTLGDGKDTISITKGDGTEVKITDYSYADDTVILADADTGTTIGMKYDESMFTIEQTSGSKVSVATNMNNGVYELNLSKDGTAATSTHFVRTDVSSVDYVAKDAINFESTKNTTALNLTLADKTKNVVNVGATEGTVNIVAGKEAANTVTVGAGVDLGLGITKKSGETILTIDGSTNAVLDSKDTLYLRDNGNISDVKFGTDGLTYGEATVKGGYDTTNGGSFNYNTNGTNGVLMYAKGTDAKGGVTYTQGVSYYANAASVDASEYGDVVLNLNGVCGDAFADTIEVITGVTSGLVAGRDNKGTEISIVTDAGKKTEVYGGAGSKGADKIDLTKADSDSTNVIWYSNGDGMDTVEGFVGHGNNSIYFHDSAAAASVLNDITKVVGSDLTMTMSKQNVLKLVGVKAVTNETNVVDFKDKAGNTFKLAVGDGTNVTYASDINVYKGATTLKVGGSDDRVIYTGAKNDQFGYYDGITTIDAKEATGTVYLSGTNTNGMEIKGGEGVNHMWGGGDKVQTLIGGEGVNVFWFGNGDGRDTAKNAKAEDGINLYNVEKIDDVAVKASTNYFTVNVGSNSLKVDLGTAKADEVLKTFTFADKAGVQYTYDTKTNKFQQK